MGGSCVFLALLLQVCEIDALFQTVNLVSGGFEFVDPGAHSSGVSEHPDHGAREDDRQYRVKDIYRFHTAELDGGNRVFGDLRASFCSLRVLRRAKRGASDLQTRRNLSGTVRVVESLIRGSHDGRT